MVVNYIREFNKNAGVPADKLYDATMYVLVAFLVIGLICNALVRPVAPKWFMKEDEVAALQARTAAAPPSGSFGIGKGGLDPMSAAFWLFVGIPIAWGVWVTLKSASVIFG